MLTHTWLSSGTIEEGNTPVFNRLNESLHMRQKCDTDVVTAVVSNESLQDTFQDLKK